MSATQSPAPEVAASGAPEAFHPYPFYSPRFWHGMRAGTWWRLLASGGFRVSPSRLPVATSLSLCTPVNDVLYAVQQLLYSRRIREAQLAGPPVFILGHWRSGTTLLHELMVLDPRLSYPNTYECFAPHHFLVSEWLFLTCCGWMLPKKRPMDNMSAGWDRPQEDEFALANLGIPSPYRRIAFPNNPPPDLDLLDWRNIPPEVETRWLEGLDRYLRALTCKTGRPLVLKSPTHTGRVGVLQRAYPEARFIHITRDPRALFPSTCRLWRSLDHIQGLQKPREEHLEEYVLECFERMYAGYHGTIDQVPASQRCEVRYDALVADPLATLRGIYDHLDLGDFEPLAEPLAEWIAENHRGYRPNRHTLPPEQEQRIRTRWADYFERYGYD